MLKTLGLILFISLLIPIIFYAGLFVWGYWHDEWSGYNYEQYVSDGVCNIAVIPVMGEIITFGEVYDEFGNELISTNISDTLTFIDKAESDPNILGLVSLIDSGGGSPSAGESIADELKKSTLPVASYIFDIGASSAYMIASAADTIIASPFSDVGSIGVTMSYLDYTEQNSVNGLEFVSLASGQFKDSGTPDKPLTEEERALFERDLEIFHDEFVKLVSENRNLPIEEVASLADGSSLPSKLALEAKLIDQIGDKEDARAWFAEKLGLPVEEVIFCN